MATTEVTGTHASGGIDLRVSPLGRVEGDLDLNVTIQDGHVTQAWTEAAMFRGFEIILRGKDPQAGLIVTPRICGICGGSHLFKSVYALDTAWATHVPENATRIRNLAQICETLQSIPRWYYALFAIDFTNKKYANSPLYEEAVRRHAAFVGTAYETGVALSNKPVEVYAIFGGQWPHSSFMVPGGVMCGPTLSDVTRSIAILEYWKDTWLEKQWLGCSIERWLENETWDDVMAWLEESDSHANSDLGFFIRFSLDVGLDKFGQGYGNYISTGTYFDPASYTNPTIEGRNDALIGRAGIYADGEYYDFDHLNVREDHTSSFFKGSAQLHPWDGVTDPIDPEQGKKEGKYSWAKAPRYDIPGKGLTPVEAGPLSRRVMAARAGSQEFQDGSTLFGDVIEKLGPSVFTRTFARVHEAPLYYQWARKWLDEIELSESFYAKPEEKPSGKGFGATEAARGALADWIVLEDGKIANYQVVTPTAWNIGPKDANGNNGPMEQAFVGSPVADPEDPVELGHVARAFDSCLVCTVHVYDGKSGRKLSKFRFGGEA